MKKKMVLSEKFLGVIHQRELSIFNLLCLNLSRFFLRRFSNSEERVEIAVISLEVDIFPSLLSASNNMDRHCLKLSEGDAMMEKADSFESQFSKLHPGFNVDTRIGIIGAGPSGLSAAYALTRLGYRNVTVLEKYHAVGGMCESVDINGKIYDLGGQVLAANSAPFIFNLAKETGSELEEMDSHKLALIDGSTGKYQDIKVADDYLSMISLTLELQDKAKGSGRIGVHAVSEFASESTLSYLDHRGFKYVPKSVAYGYTASGYGFVQDMPYAYVHEFTRTSMAGKIRRFKGGYTSLWEKISKSLPIKLHCNTEVLAVRRYSESVSVDVKDYVGELKTLEFDKIIISGNFYSKYGRTYRSNHSTEYEGELMDASQLEKELFSKIQTIDYYTTVLEIKGLDYLPMGFYYFGEYMDNPESIGYPVAMQRFYADSDIFLFWSYGNSDNIKGPTVCELAISSVRSMGGQVTRMILQRRFNYFPHVGSDDMKDGFYEKLESELQGSRNTYYVGGLMAFELTERNSSYAMALICKHFANDNPLPVIPYVKSMFPLRLEFRETEARDFGELTGVEFPNLYSLDSYLKHWATHSVTRDKTLYTWLDEEGSVANCRTYRELHANASCIAQELLKSRKPVIRPGDRVLLVHVPGLDFVDSFFGCLRAKVLPVPVLPPDPLQRGGQALVKIENIAKSCGAVAILSTVSYHSAVRIGLLKNALSFGGKGVKSSAGWPKLPWLHTDLFIKNSKKSLLEGVADQSEPEADDLCFLQFTSGSTGDAKGVMITHGGLVHNVKLMRRKYKSTSKTVLVSWLPQYHDMGLIGGLFTAMVSGGSAVLFSPLAFIKNPLLWLQTMSRYQATHSAGPNFAFELVIRRLESAKEKLHKYDLSSLIFLMVAAEPVRAKTLKRFLQLTIPLGLSEDVMAPGYGLAENCVFVSCAFGEGKPIFMDWQERVCCGYVDSNDGDVDIRIVNPETGVELKEAEKEGEIWISSPSAGIGYWGRDELSQETFGNELENHPGRKYCRTGDLGRVIDRKLFITGRIKDLIIVAGRNVYSADVEKTVESSSELIRPGCCAVVGVPEEILLAKGISVPDHSDQVGLVVIAEVKDGKCLDKDLIEQIHACVAEEHGVNVASVKLIKPRTMSKTTSGKIKRFECLKQFTEETLQLVPRPISVRRSLTRSFTTGTCREGQTPRPDLVRNFLPGSAKLGHAEIVEFLKGLVSEQTGLPIKKISSTEGLVSYGIDSIGVVRAAQKLSDFLGVPIGAVDIFTASCIADLASFSENVYMKSHPQLKNYPGNFPETEINSAETEIDSTELVMEKSKVHKLGIWVFQLLALTFVAAMLVFPAYLSIYAYLNSLSALHRFTADVSWVNYLVALILAPVSWILCMISSCISVAFFGNCFLRPNYALNPEISMCSLDFIKWWALYKAQQIASKVLAVHLRGSVFLRYWFEMLGARIGGSVLLDTVDITDPDLVSIGDGVVIAEGTLLQSHEIKNGVLSFLPIRIGRNSSIAPYSIIQKGSILGEGAEVLPLQKISGKYAKGTTVPKGAPPQNNGRIESDYIYHLLGIYLVGFLSSISAAIVYYIYSWLVEDSLSLEYFTFCCIAGAFHWIPYSLIAYSMMFVAISSNPLNFAVFFSSAYLVHGIILIVLTCTATWLLTSKLKASQNPLKTWFCHRITIACHVRFAKFLSGTEAFCIYLRLLGAKVGKYCSIRAINPVSDPQMVQIGDGVHLGDFSRIIPSFYSSNWITSGKIELHENSVIGSQSLVLPGSSVQKNAILGALSVAPVNSVLQKGGVYIGSEAPIMIKNTLHTLDERIEEMDVKYKKIVGNLAANLAATTLKVKTRYFHRVGVGGKGYLKIYDKINGFPHHNIFSAGKKLPMIIRHSNSLSADDDARIDARGAAIKILSDASDNSSILDLTLKTGNAFYARTIADFASWLVCGIAAREEHVKRVPHIREAVWNSLRQPDSFTELHYYSNICRLFRFEDGEKMYVKFKLRPYDGTIGEDSGRVEPRGILPPETGAIPRDDNDTRPLLFLAEDFQNRVNSSGGVQYIFQIQFRPVPVDEADREDALDCTKPWDDELYPYIDIGEINIDENLSREESERLEFNPFLKCHDIDVIRASSVSESASIDHGRSLIYEICQHLRNGEALPETWRIFLERSDVKLDLSGCPMAAALERQDDTVTLARAWYYTMWVASAQPLLQTALPYFIIGLIIYGPLKWILYQKEAEKIPLNALLTLFWVFSGMLACFSCVVAKWLLVRKKKEGESVLIWSTEVFMDTTWQAIKTLVGDYFMEMTSGSFLFLLSMKLMGSAIDVDPETYVDSMEALLNPEMVEIERGGCVGREALLFGHVYEGEGGRVKFGKIRVGEDASIGSRAIAMPGVQIESGATLNALTLAMKEETVKFR